MALPNKLITAIVVEIIMAPGQTFYSWTNLAAVGGFFQENAKSFDSGRASEGNWTKTNAIGRVFVQQVVHCRNIWQIREKIRTLPKDLSRQELSATKDGGRRTRAEQLRSK